MFLLVFCFCFVISDRFLMHWSELINLRILGLFDENNRDFAFFDLHKRILVLV